MSLTVTILAEAAHGHEGSNWEQYLDLLTSLPHIGLELTIEAITGSVAYLLGWRPGQAQGHQGARPQVPRGGEPRRRAPRVIDFHFN